MPQPRWMEWMPPVKLDCSYPQEHADHHHPHPDPHPQREARLVCYACHPPACVLLERARDGKA